MLRGAADTLLMLKEESRGILTLSCEKQKDDVANELGWIKQSAKDVGQVLRDYRNYIHPEKELSHGITVDGRDTSMFVTVFCSMAEQIIATVWATKAHNPMTAKEALDAANAAEPGERLRRYESRCGPRESCRREPLERDPGQWTWDCLTVRGDSGTVGARARSAPVIRSEDSRHGAWPCGWSSVALPATTARIATVRNPRNIMRDL